MKKKITITLDEELIEKVEKLAEEEDRNLSSQINYILKKYFKESN